MPGIVQGRDGGAGIQTQAGLSLEAVLFVTTQESFRMRGAGWVDGKKVGEVG